MADKNALMAGRNIQESFNKVLIAAKHHFPDPDLVILSGDLSHDDEKADYLVTYSRLAQMLKQQFKKAVCIPGNHDDAELVKRIFPLYGINASGVTALDNWQFILVDSSQKDKPAGWLADEELKSLDRALKDKQAENNSASSGNYNLIIIHHPVLDLGSSWLDQQKVGNADQLFKMLALKKNVQGIVCGHAHQSYDVVQNQIQIMGSPATCPRQFAPLSDLFAEDETVTPGFRCLTLYPDGKLKTRVYRI